MNVNVNFQSLCRKMLFVCAILVVLSAALVNDCSAQRRSEGPCDIFASVTPCVAAYSTTRALYSSYNGSLYRVMRQSDHATADIGVLHKGYANVSVQDSFCAKTTCTITELYDQTSNHNNLTVAPPGGNGRGAGPNGYDLPVNASALPVLAGGHKVYGMYFEPGMGYRDNATTGIAVNGQAEGVYMVSSSVRVNAGCCFDFGNAETNNNDNKAGHMDAINIMCNGIPCKPAVGLDQEDGIYGFSDVPEASEFVSAMGSTDGKTSYSVYVGNAQSGSLTTKGPQALTGPYLPLSQEGGIILGIGGDNSIMSIGNFFEGVMTKGAPSSSILNLVQSNIVAVGYVTSRLP